MLLLVIVLALSATGIVPFDPVRPDYSAVLQAPSLRHLFGTDELGRDVLVRVLVGGRISLLAGLVPVAIAMTIGSLAGLVAGYAGGRVDSIIMRLADVLLAFPALVLLVAVSAVLGPGLQNGLLAISVIMIPRFARVVRGQTLTLAHQEFVDSARILGATPSRIVLRHVLPNTTSPIIVVATLAAAEAILAEGSLSFLGLGTQPPDPSWGAMISQGFRFLQLAPWITFAPGGAIFLTVLAINFLGDALRDILDPTLRLD
ncbi:MAG: ABC transporter permease [Chloroflexi bacterium]|nr:ABC transporter permease [Chloroflexota bacterium]MCL5111063.1 ABC transporter permease [Chloroflexota bacterium]